MFTNKRGRLPPETRAQIIAALEDNPNASAVARKVGYCATTVTKIARETSIELTAGQAVGRLPTERSARIFAELKANPNARAVARKIGERFELVTRVAKREGIKLTAGLAARGHKLPQRNRVARQTAQAAKHAP
jgi:transposase-like protein